MSSQNWKWKSKSGATGGLLYEPGNWGDILKAGWLLSILERITGNYLDLFAGAPSYPLSKMSSLRLREAGVPVLNAATASWVSNSLWPSAASFAAAGGGRQVAVFDIHEQHRQAFSGVEGIQVIDADDGWTALEQSHLEAGDLLMVDPYDFLGVWRERTELVCSQPSSTLIYIYNRSARKAETLRSYRDFRNHFDTLLEGRRYLLGRIPADGFLPDAHHEMLFIPSALHADEADLLSALREVTLTVESAVRRRSVFIEQG